MTNESFQQYVLDKLDKIAEDVALLKGKSVVWGAVGGAIATTLLSLVALFLGSHIKKG